MEPISVTLSAGGRPFLTTRLRSVIFDDSARVQRPERADRAEPQRFVERSPANGVGQARAEGAVAASKGTDGFGETAIRNLFLARTGEDSAAPVQSGGVERPATAENPDGLTDAERDQVDKLRARDAEVRRHEQAHAAVGGQYAGAPTYTYQLGPDGRRYAIGGEVKIDVAPIPGDPEATIEKMGVVKSAALAPAEPSAADRRVAALADAQRLEAVAELATLRTEERLEAFEESSILSDTTSPESSEQQPQKPDNRFAVAGSVLSRGDDLQPGQKLNTAA